MVFMKSDINDNEFDSSDEEDGPADDTAIPLDWLTIPCNQLNGYPVDGRLYTIGICAMPGCRYRSVRRSMVIDLESLQKDGVQDVFVFCNHSELKMCHADDLLYRYDRRGFKVHYYPVANDQTMSVSKCVPILCEIETCLRAGRKIILQCVDGLGKSCTVAGALWLFLDKHVTPLVVMETLCQLRGPMAIARVKHYNYLNDFRKNAALVLSST